MLTFMSTALVATVVAPALMAMVAFGAGRRSSGLIGRLGAGIAGLGFAVAVALAFSAGRGEPVTASLGPLDLAADRLAAVLLLLVFGVSAIVQTFALRYLAGDSRATWFTGGAGLLTAASAGLMTAATLVGLAVFWSLAGLSLCLLLGMYWQLPAARDGVRRTAAAFLIGDLALWAAVGLATATWGRVELRNVVPGEFTGWPTAVIAILVVVAALSRSAQIPFHRWLPATLTAPTPVSALLHAGVVNAGGILLVRMAPLASDDLARGLSILAGAATMAYGAVIMLVKPDIKGALVNSTTAQMGFMILTCGLGLWAAAVIHLVAHGFYKSTLFLSSGSAVAAQRRAEFSPPALTLTRTQQILNAVIAVLLPAGALAAAVALIPTGSSHAAEQALLIFAFVTAAAVTWGWLKRRPGIPGAVLGAAFLVPAAIGYVGIVNGLTGYLDPALPPSTLPVAVVWLIAGAALAGLGVLAAVRSAPGAERLQRLLYTNALAAGHIPAPAAQPLTQTSVQLTGARS